MPSLEYAVRPFTTPNAQGSIIIPSTPKSPPARATLVWGSKATMPTVASGISFQVACCNETLNEQSREAETVRITQSDNPDNWVDVQRPISVKLQKHEQSTCGDNWDQLSGVGAEVSAELAAYAADIHSGTAASPTDMNCNTSWKFKNQ